MNNKRVIILGAGLAGLSAAWHLKKRGIDFQLFEKEPEVGGLCRSRRAGRFTFDCDGHLLHFRHRYSFDLVKGFLQGNLAEHQRDSRIYTHGRYTHYPFQANLYGLPLPMIKECLLGLVKASDTGSRAKENGLTFLEWIKLNFGEGIARHFLVPYNKKFWTVHPGKMTCEWLKGFVPVPSLAQIIEGTIEESPREFGYNARFWYPKRGGIGELAGAMSAEIKNVHTSSAATEIDPIRKEIRLECGEKVKFDRLVTTLPLPEMSSLIKNLPQEVRSSLKLLRWNSVFNLNLGLKKKLPQEMHWAYFPQEEISFFRAGFFENFSPDLAPGGRGSVYAEVSYSRNKPLERGNISQRIKTDLRRTGILCGKDGILEEDHNDIRYAYPIYDMNYSRSRETAVRYLAESGITACGRYGSWRYFSMEDSLLDGRRAAELLY